mgnify:CR=1 FL=1
MCVGDLVKIKTHYSEAWIEYNSRLNDGVTGEIGMILCIAKIGKSLDAKVLWPSGMTWVDKANLELA